MNFDQLKNLLTTDPNGRASTSRFRLAGGTLWYKDDEKLFHPIISHFHKFVVDWGPLSSYYHDYVGMSSRASNQLSSLRNEAKYSWLNKLGEHGVVDTRKPKGEHNGGESMHSAPSIKFKFPNRKRLGVKKPTALAAKMLLMGKHPEDDSDRLDWCTRGKDTDSRAALLSHEQLAALRKGGSDRYQNSFIKPFEEAVRSLAYGAVRRENDLRDMAKPLHQMKCTLDANSNDLVDEMASLVEHRDGITGLSAPFAPELEEAGEYLPPQLIVFRRLLEEFSSLSDRCHEAAAVYANVASAPDSICPSSLTTSVDEDWGVQWPSDIGTFEGMNTWRRWNQHPDGIGTSVSNSALLVVRAKAEVTETEEGDGIELPGIGFVEHNVRGFSYYWVRKHKELYETVLNQAGIKLPNLFGLTPLEWNYMELAAPLFMEDTEQVRS